MTSRRDRNVREVFFVKPCDCESIYTSFKQDRIGRFATHKYRDNLDWVIGEIAISCDTTIIDKQIQIPKQLKMGYNIRIIYSLHVTCQGMTCFLLQKHLGVFPTPTSDTFSILQTPTTSQFWRHFGVLLIPSPFQQSPMLLHAPSTPTPCPTPPLKVAPRPLPPPKVAQWPLQTPHTPIWTPLWHSLETLQVVAEIGRL